MILYIDATDFNQVTFAVKNGRVKKYQYKIDPHKSHELLGNLEDFFNRHKITKSDIKKIIINKGPDSYTGVRISAAIAKGLSLAWKVPVTAIEKEKFKV